MLGPRRPRLTFVLCSLLGAAACERARDAAPGDTPLAEPSAPAESVAVAEPPVRTWNERAGPALIVAADAPDRALVVFPEFTDSTLTDSTTFDLAPIRDARLELLSRAGRAGSATVAGRGPAPAEDCVGWPAIRVAARDGAVPPWTVSFVQGRVTPVPLDSIEGLASADSARLAAEVTRIAAALPGDTSSAFRDIPFSVRSARRFHAAPGIDAFVAEIVRKVALEANPREEHLLVVAERDSGQTGRYAPAFSERTSGPEESVQSSDVLAAVTIGGAAGTTLVLRRDDGSGGSYALLERFAPRRWRVRWTSAYTGC